MLLPPKLSTKIIFNFSDKLCTDFISHERMYYVLNIQ